MTLVLERIGRDGRAVEVQTFNDVDRATAARIVRQATRCGYIVHEIEEPDATTE